jgi:hypothetical protein
MINEVELRDNYEYQKRIFFRYSEQNKFKEALKHANYACSVARRFPIIPDFMDVEVENELNKLAIKITHEDKPSISQEGGVLFFSSQTVDNGALTEQYLDYLISRKESYLYLTTDAQANVRGQRIFSKAKDKSIVESEGEQQIVDLVRIINAYNPKEIWVHLAPDHAEACAALSIFKTIPGIFINHNSHSFSLGFGLGKKIIEFHMGGVYTSMFFRGIKAENIGFIPFYPSGLGENIVAPKDWSYSPRREDGLCKLLVAGNRSKILHPGEEGVLLAITKALNEIDNLEIWIATIGSDEEIKKYFSKLGLINRVKLLGYQKRLDTILEQVDGLVDTFPFAGGLIRQIAIRNFKPIFRISTNGLRGMLGSKEVFLSEKDFDSLTLQDFIHDLKMFALNGLNKDQIETLKELYYSFPDREVFQNRVDEFRNDKKGFDSKTVEQYWWSPVEYLDCFIQIENAFNNRFYFDEFKQLGMGASFKTITMAAKQLPSVILSRIV